MSIDKNERKKLKIHSKHHKGKHMAIMNAMMNSGKSFEQAHRAALKIENRKT